MVFAKQIAQEILGPVDDIHVALAAGERTLDAIDADRFDLCDRRSVQLPVVALAQACVLMDRQRGTCERDLHRLDCAAEVRREDGGDAVVAAPLAPLAGGPSP